MKTRLLSLSLFAAALIPLAFSTGCAHEVSHTESDKPGWFGGRTHKESTVYQNSDGTTSSSSEKRTTSP